MLAIMFIISLCVFAASNCLAETGGNPNAYAITRPGKWYEEKMDKKA